MINYLIYKFECAFTLRPRILNVPHSVESWSFFKYRQEVFGNLGDIVLDSFERGTGATLDELLVEAAPPTGAAPAPAASGGSGQQSTGDDEDDRLMAGLRGGIEDTSAL